MNVLLCPMSDPGYLYPCIAIGRELRGRGAAVHALGRERVAPLLAEAGLPFQPAEPYGALRSFRVARWASEVPGQYQAIRLAAQEVRADLLVTSVLCHGALLAAEALDLPVVVVGFAAHIWGYAGGAGDEPELPACRPWRDREMRREYQRSREQAGLPPRRWTGTDHPLYGTALLLRGDPALEYPGALLPERVHHVGPCVWEPAASPDEIAPILHRLDLVGKPVVYVHLGRVFGGKSMWPLLNAAFTNGPFQALLELGRSPTPEPADGADLVLIRKPWLQPLIDRAGLVLTQGTSTPVLAALLAGRPLALSPAGSEQPLLAEACVRAGVGVAVPNDPGRDPVGTLLAAWHDEHIRARAEWLGHRLATAGGARLAADIIADIWTGRPVSHEPAVPAGTGRPDQEWAWN
jgi:UDP:flavonoid glycosyltransferase YjiC (YdhE family)